MIPRHFIQRQQVNMQWNIITCDVFTGLSWLNAANVAATVCFYLLNIIFFQFMIPRFRHFTHRAKTNIQINGDNLRYRPINPLRKEHNTLNFCSIMKTVTCFYTKKQTWTTTRFICCAVCAEKAENKKGTKSLGEILNGELWVMWTRGSG